VELLVFEIGGHRYALPAPEVREVVRAVTIVPLPDAPPLIEGIINVRGHVVPVLDVRARLGLARRPISPADHLILATAGDGVVALRVDRVLDLARIPTADIDDAHALVPDARSMSGIAKLSDGLVLIQDPRGFLDPSGHAALDASLRSAAPRMELQP
jgi:purine-binding chemotaxis protein CheW